MDVASGRTELTSSNDNTYTVTDGQLFLNAWNSSSPTFACDVVLNGEGYQNGGSTSETKCALRLHEGATLSGTLTIAGSTRIWSSGAANTISGDVVTTDSSATVSIVQASAYNPLLLTFTGSSIALPTLDLSSGALVAFSSSDITFSAITGSGTLTFASGSQINVAEGQTLSISASSLTFGDTLVSEDTDLGSLNSYFTGAELAGISFNGNTLTITAIPEPSAFGLLAGAGALALVAARRRRAK